MKIIIMAVAVFLSAGITLSDVFDFTVTNGAFDFNTPTGQITTNGITMNFAAIVAGDENAKLNAGSGYFGVNASVGTDNASLVDSGQSITISFSSSLYTSIKLQTIAVGAWTDGSDAGYYQIDDGAQISLVKLNNNLDPEIEVLGKTLTFSSTAGNGISFNGITVNAVPEPATLAMMGFAGVLALLIRRMSRA
ncbi:MAG: PEP-CTERM sorting domain-containing protein [Kiritimatiellales bacterium]|nr:PEP-CTERM sorting domain-containing protein [Kiritimatiellales bacterium]